MTMPIANAGDSRWLQTLTDRPFGSDAVVSTGAGTAPEGAVQAPTPVQVQQAVHEVNATLESQAVGLQFEIDKDTDMVIVRVIEKESGEVIRQIPTEEVVRIAKVLGRTSGALVSHNA